MARIDIDARLDVESLSQEELEVSTITLYQSEVGVNRGHLIAVNAEYICYAIRGGMVRAINRADASRALMRGFSEYAVDMSLSPTPPEDAATDEDDGESLLAVVGNDGHLFVWSLASMDGTLEPTVVLAVDERSATTRAGLTDRVIWRPHAPEHEPGALILASVLCDGQALCLWAIKLNDAGGSAAREHASLLLDVGGSPDSDRAVRDLAFTPEGSALAVAVGDEVRVFDLHALSAAAILNGSGKASPAFAVLRVPAAGGGRGCAAPIESVRPVAPGTFLIATDGNKMLELWSQPSSGGMCALAARADLTSSTADSSYGLATCPPPPSAAAGGGAGADHFAPPLVLLCSRTSGRVLALSTTVLPDGSGARFVACAAFHAALPVLSFCAAVEARGGAGEAGDHGAGGAEGGAGGLELSVFAVQATAIQRLGFKAHALPTSSVPAEAAAPPTAPAAPENGARAMAEAPAGMPPVQTPADAPPAAAKPPPSAPSASLEAALKRLASGGLASTAQPPTPPPTPAAGVGPSVAAPIAEAAAMAAAKPPPKPTVVPKAAAAMAASTPVQVLARPKPAPAATAPALPAAAEAAPPQPAAPARSASAPPQAAPVVATAADATAAPPSDAIAALVAAHAAQMQAASQAQAAAQQQHGTVMAALQQILNNQKRAEAAAIAAADKSRVTLLSEIGKEIASAEKRLLASLTQRIEANGKALAGAVSTRIDLLSARVDATSGAVEPAVRGALERALPAVLDASARATAPHSAALVANALRPELGDVLAKAAARAVADHVGEAMRAQFERALLPAVEAAVSQAGSQLLAAVDKGSASAGASAASAAAEACTAQLAAVGTPVAEAVAAKLATTLQAAVRGAIGPALEQAMLPLTAEVGALRGTVGAPAGTAKARAPAQAGGSAADSARAAAAAPAPVVPARDLRAEAVAEIEALRAAGFIEKAFATALSSADRDIVLSLMAQLGPQELIQSTDHSASTVASKQIVLISLLQQIGMHLSTPPSPSPSGTLAPHDASWPELQARWLSDCLLALEPSEPVIAASVPAVLSAVEQGLVASMALPAARDSLRQLSIALHVVRSLQR